MERSGGNSNIRLAVDAVLFAVQNKKLRVLLVKIDSGVYQNKWAVPGGLVGINEDLEEAVKRVALQKANVGNVYFEQLYTFGNPKRDTRGRAISVAYFALIDDMGKFAIKAPAHYSDIKWHEIGGLPEMAFDHKEIIAFAHKRLKSKIEYTNIVYSLLPKEFTLTQLQEIYEIIWERKVDKRNFRKRMLTSGLIEKSEKMLSGRASRPARLFGFRKRKLEFFA